MSFDISALAATETFDIELLNPGTGEPIIGDEGRPCSVTVYGPGTKQYAAAQTRHSNRNMKRLKAKGKTDTTPEEELEGTASVLSEITVSLNNFAYKDQSEGRDAFRALYLDRSMGWLTDQVNKGAGDWGNFSTAAPTS